MQKETDYPNYGFINTICVVGHGSIGRGTVPLIRRHFNFDKMVIIDPNPQYVPETTEKVSFLKEGLNKENYKSVLDGVFEGKTRMCVNVSMGVSSASIIAYCQTKEILYVDSSN